MFIRCSVVSQLLILLSSLSPESPEPDSIDFGESERMAETDSFSSRINPPSPRWTRALVKLKRRSFKIFDLTFSRNFKTRELLKFYSFVTREIALFIFKVERKRSEKY